MAAAQHTQSHSTTTPQPCVASTQQEGEYTSAKATQTDRPCWPYLLVDPSHTGPPINRVITSRQRQRDGQAGRQTEKEATKRSPEKEESVHACTCIVLLVAGV
mmetsp:Transcript_20322/g.58085  ORF Transcript_20322/g.58085 Transcript_20322/m.58085 type:complete len:103 (-) Transcript_20322:611-919(-)